MSNKWQNAEGARSSGEKKYVCSFADAFFQKAFLRPSPKRVEWGEDPRFGARFKTDGNGVFRFHISTSGWSETGNSSFRWGPNTDPIPPPPLAYSDAPALPLILLPIPWDLGRPLPPRRHTRGRSPRIHQSNHTVGVGGGHLLAARARRCRCHNPRPHAHEWRYAYHHLLGSSRSTSAVAP